MIKISCNSDYFKLFESITHLSAERASSACDEASMASSPSRRGLAGLGVPAWTAEDRAKWQMLIKGSMKCYQQIVFQVDRKNIWL